MLLTPYYLLLVCDCYEATRLLNDAHHYFHLLVNILHSNYMIYSRGNMTFSSWTDTNTTIRSITARLHMVLGYIRQH